MAAAGHGAAAGRGPQGTSGTTRAAEAAFVFNCPSGTTATAAAAVTGTRQGSPDPSAGGCRAPDSRRPIPVGQFWDVTLLDLKRSRAPPPTTTPRPSPANLPHGRLGPVGSRPPSRAPRPALAPRRATAASRAALAATRAEKGTEKWLQPASGTTGRRPPAAPRWMDRRSPGSCWPWWPVESGTKHPVQRMAAFSLVPPSLRIRASARRALLKACPPPAAAAGSVAPGSFPIEDQGPEARRRPGLIAAQPAHSPSASPATRTRG